ncbi:MAG: hypothetical protein QM648_06480 [Solirubrobacterales bacterium]
MNQVAKSALWTVAALVGLIVVVGTIVLAFGLVRSVKDTTITGDEIVPALESTGYRVHYRHLPPRDGARKVVAGTAMNEDGVKLEFAIVLPDPSPSARPDVPMVWMVDAPEHSSIGNVVVSMNGFSKIPGDTRAMRRAREQMEFRVEDALLDQMPDVPPGPGV